MTDEQALLRSVLLDPANDLPRLVLADWLEEHGQGEQAEFIRVQIELARMELSGIPRFRTRTGQPTTDDFDDELEKWETLRRRGRELWTEVIQQCLRSLPDDFVPLLDNGEDSGGGNPGAIVRRGFVSEVSCDLETLFGGPCLACGRPWTGRRRRSGRSSGTGQSFCHTCHGTGRIPGIARELFSSQPVQIVTLTDREPICVARPAAGVRGEWWWSAEGNDFHSSNHDIPSELLTEHFDYGPHPTREAAQDYLSGRIVEWGRSLAGLPALEVSA